MDEKTIIVTGGSSGIGLEIVKTLLDHKFQVIAIDCKSSNELKETKAHYFNCDLEMIDNIEKTFSKIEKQYDSLFGLVNNAGVLSYGNVEELSLEDWEQVMNINVKAPFLCSKYAIPLMKDDGIIVNVASIQSLFAQAKVAAYATSKAAILGLTRSIAIDYAGKVRCVAVCPGTIDTPMLHNALKQSNDPAAMMSELNATHLTKRIGKAKEVAELINFICSDKCQFINGTEIRVDGGLGVNLGGSIDS